MKVEELRNFGKGFRELDPSPETVKKARTVIRREMRKELGLFGSLGFLWSLKRETNRAMKLDWSSLMAGALKDQVFLKRVVQRSVMTKVLISMVGRERASKILFNLMDLTALDLMKSIQPSVQEFQACGEILRAFKKYVIASFVANEREGIHKLEISEDTPDAFAFNVNYCVWNEIAKKLGDPYYCYPSSCYGDEVVFPKLAAEVGFRFKRNGTLATGQDVCDFRFERMP